jgi:MoaA/NifB/PqqE/SkfB family radical SAM enzyme
MIQRYFSLIKNIFASNCCQLPTPYKLTWVVTDQCNQKCQICNIWQKPPGNLLPLEEIDNLFKYNDFSWVDLTGGEIFLRNDLLEIIKCIFDRQRKLLILHIPTNGLMTSKIVSTVEQIAKFPNRSPKIIITVSIDGPKQINDHMRGITGAWEKSIQTYRALGKIKEVDAYIGMTLSRINLSLISKTYAALKEKITGLEPRDIHINLPQTSSHYYANNHQSREQFGQEKSLMAAIDNFLKFRGSQYSPVGFLDNQYLAQAQNILSGKKNRFTCKALSASCFINQEGEIYPCSIWDEPLGNIKQWEYRLNKLWDNTIQSEMRKLIMDNKCPGCWTPCEANPSLLGNIPNLIGLSCRNSA